MQYCGAEAHRGDEPFWAGAELFVLAPTTNFLELKKLILIFKSNFTKIVYNLWYTKMY